MDHRDRRAPEPLARDQPVAQAIGLRGATGAGLLELLDDARDRVALGQSVERLRVDHPAVAGQRDAGPRGVEIQEGGLVRARIDRNAALVELDHGNGAGHRCGGVHHDLHRQIERAREVEVALVVRGDGHDGAVAVVGQDVVRGPDRQALAVDRVDRVALEEDAGLGPVGGLTFDVRLASDRFEVVLEAHADVRRRAGSELRREVAVGGHDEEGRTVQGVGTRREDRDGALASFDLEVDVGADGAADPVALHPDDLLRPEALELVQVVEQAIGVVGDLEVPLRELLLHDLGAAALAPAVHDLLVGEHGLVVRAPVDRALLAVGQVALVQALEQPLVPAVVLGVARVEDARPVVRRAVLAEALLVLRDVLVGPLAGLGAALDGRVLGGQAEGVPADRVQHVVAAVTPEARDHVDVGVALGVTHVQVARGVREHAEHVLARARVLVAAGAERVGLGPARLPLLLGRVRVVASAFSGRSGVGRGLGHVGNQSEGCRGHRKRESPGYRTAGLTIPCGRVAPRAPSGPARLHADFSDLGCGIRSPRDASPGADVRAARMADDRSDHHREVERAVVAHPAEASREHPARRALELVEDRHRRQLRRAGHAAGGKRRVQQIADGDPVAQSPRHGAHQLMDRGVRLDHQQRVDADRARRRRRARGRCASGRRSSRSRRAPSHSPAARRRGAGLRPHRLRAAGCP